MNVKQAIIMEAIKNERTYTLILPIGAPFGEAYDATFEFLNSVLEMSKQAADNARQELIVADPQAEVE